MANTPNDSFFNSKKSVPAGKMEQLAYTEKCKAKKVLELKATIPDSLIPDASAAGILCGKGNLLRVKGTAGGFISFGPDATLAAPSILTPNTMETEVGYFFIIATDEFVRTSALMRIEVTID